MTNYQIIGVKERTDYSFALKIIHERLNNFEIKHYDRKNGILFLSTDAEIDSVQFNTRLSEKGLILKVSK